MNKIIFERCNTSELNTIREPSRITLEIDTNLDITEFKITCIRLAHAMGYSNESVKREFGVDTERGNPEQLKLLLD